MTEAGPAAVGLEPPERLEHPRYSVVVPVYEEADNIAPLCRELRRRLPPGYEVLFCYDLDEEPSLAAFARLAAAERPTAVTWIRNRLGAGARYAVEAGFRAARAPVVLVSMADLSDDYAKVEEMVRRAEAGADVVCASRYIHGGRQVGGPLLKSLLSRAAGLSLHWLTGVPTHDPTNSFKAYRREFLAGSPIESRRGFCFSLELTLKAHFSGGRVEELPATWTGRTAGESQFRLLRWLPEYLYWYFWGVKRRLQQAIGRRTAMR